MPFFVAVETFDFGQVWGGTCLGYIARGWSSSVGPRSCTSVHWYGYVVKIPWGIERVVLGAQCLRGRGILSPVLVGPGRGALILIHARAYGGEAIAEGNINAVPCISGIDSRLS